MSMETIRNLDNIVQIAVLLTVAAGAFLSLGKSARPMSMAFFALGMTTYLVSDIYWIAHLLLKGGSRLPFTAADMGDFGLFLLLASASKAVFEGDSSRPPFVLTVAVSLFGLSNIALWTAWNGEWIRNLIGGIALGYYYWRVARDLWAAKALSRREWQGLLVLCVVLIGLLIGWFWLTASWRKRVEYGCYVLLFAGIVWFYAKTVLALRSGRSKAAVSLAFATLAWSACTMYMCWDPIYYAADTAFTLTAPLALLALRQEACVA